MNHLLRICVLLSVGALVLGIIAWNISPAVNFDAPEFERRQVYQQHEIIVWRLFVVSWGCAVLAVLAEICQRIRPDENN